MSKNGGLAGLACGFLFACVEACLLVGSGRSPQWMSLASMVPTVAPPTPPGRWVAESAPPTGHPRPGARSGVPLRLGVWWTLGLPLGISYFVPAC
jgi:hypothetical protein